MLPGSAVVPLLSFMALLLSASLYGLAASGHFPAEHRAPALRTGVGRIVLFGSLALCLFCLVGGIALVWHHRAVVRGGDRRRLTVLIALLLLQPFPDLFVNGRAALLTFSGLSLAMTALLLFVG